MRLGEVAKLIRKKKHLTLTEVAQKMGDYDAAALSRVERGKQSLTDNRIEDLSRALGVSPSYLYKVAETNGAFLNEASDILSSEEYWDNNTSQGPDIKSRVPIISSVQAGNWKSIKGLILNNTDAEYVNISTIVSGDAFALRVEGDSMTNPNGGKTLPEGSVVVVDTGKTIDNGCIVVALRAGHDEATIKQFVKEGEDMFLKPLNPRYPLIPIDKNCIIIGKVVQAFTIF